MVIAKLAVTQLSNTHEEKANMITLNIVTAKILDVSKKSFRVSPRKNMMAANLSDSANKNGGAENREHAVVQIFMVTVTLGCTKQEALAGKPKTCFCSEKTS